MKCFMYLLSALMTVTYAIKSAEYLYPVASCDNGSTALLIQQKSCYDIQLLLWNTYTNHVEKGLWSLFKPAGLQLLPDESGFSFIDNGRLRVKYFNKRSVQTIDFDQYFYMINLVNWINTQECYCSARMADYYALFHCTIDGYSCCIASSDKGNCLYPQKINSYLFYIEESYNLYVNTTPQYSIKRMIYPTITYNETQSYIATQSTPSIIIDFKNKPIIFLHMISDTQGFVIEHAREIHINDASSTFLYHHLSEQDGIWQSTLLFSFDIPTNLFVSNTNQSLYESLLPLIPRVIGKKIYFIDSAHNSDNNLESYTYDIEATTIEKNDIVKINSFVPIICGENIIFGGMINSAKDLQIFNF
jgi:hypothetical protein